MIIELAGGQKKAGTWRNHQTYKLFAALIGFFPGL
jgi:hypothetical protein